MYRLFVDLDGVLADFEKGVKKFTGQGPREYKSVGQMWREVSKVSDFYNRLEWMPDGKYLWESVEPFYPTILTGIPFGNIPWAEQKRKWCDKHLGRHTPLIIKHPRETKLQAAENAFHLPQFSDESIRHIKENKWILIDDDTKHAPDWTNNGGIFIHHTKVLDTITELADILERDKD
jgi:hypothetical protein